MPRLGPAERAAIGATVLAAARIVDTASVRPTLARFAAAHQRYTDAQRAVAAAEAQVDAARLQFNVADREQAMRTVALAGALVTVGQPRANPFRGYDVPPPTALARLSVAAEARAIRRLVSIVRHQHPAAPLVLERATAAETAADAAVAALAALTAARTTGTAARRARDAIGREWDHALSALNRATRAAADDGAADLHPALFGAIRRSPPRRPRTATSRTRASATRRKRADQF